MDVFQKTTPDCVRAAFKAEMTMPESRAPDRKTWKDGGPKTPLVFGIKFPKTRIGHTKPDAAP